MHSLVQSLHLCTESGMPCRIITVEKIPVEFCAVTPKNFNCTCMPSVLLAPFRLLTYLRQSAFWYIWYYFDHCNVVSKQSYLILDLDLDR